MKLQTGAPTLGLIHIRSVLAAAATAIACSGGNHDASTAPITPPSATLSIAINGGTGQSAFIGSPLLAAPSVIVRNGSGAPAAGIAVTFSVVGAGGTVTGASQTTNALGVATVGGWTLGSIAGVDSMSATASGASGTAVFTATALPAVLTVVNASDLVNGSVSSPSALVASPGADGISLREALTAVTKVSIPFQVTFAQTLAGSTIALASPLPHLTANGTQLVGIAGADGQPAITLDGGGIASCCANATIRIVASRVTVSTLRFTRINSKNRAIMISSGAPAEPQSYDSVTVTRNVFDNGVLADTAWGIVVSTIGPQSSGTITNLAVTRNTFRHFQGDSDGLLIESRGVGSVIRGVDVSDNVFTDCQFGFELAHPDCRRCRIRNVRLLRNTFTGSVVFDVTFGNGPIPGATSIGNMMDSIVIANNSFTAFGAAALGVNAGYAGGTTDTIAAVWFVNNTVRGKGSGSGVGFAAGSDSGSAGNRLADVTIAGNTIKQVGQGISVNVGSGAATDNSIADLSIVSNVIDSTIHGAFITASNNAGAARNRIDRLIIAGNRFSRQTNGIGVRINGGTNTGSSGTVATVSLTNNIFQDELAGVQVFAGAVNGSANVIADVHATNNTLYGVTLGFSVNTFGQTVTGTELRNSIFAASTSSAANHTDIGVSAGATLVAAFNITDAVPFAGQNGNVTVDPMFVDAAGGDFHLKTGSPAIRSGTTTNAPPTDYACNPRTGTPDLGAYAFGSTGYSCTVTYPSLNGQMSSVRAVRPARPGR